MRLSVPLRWRSRLLLLLVVAACQLRPTIGQNTADVTVVFPPALQCGQPLALTLVAAQWNTFWDPAVIQVFGSPVGALAFPGGRTLTITDGTPRSLTVTPAMDRPGAVTLVFQTTSIRVNPMANRAITIDCPAMSTMLMTPGCGLKGSSETDGVVDPTNLYPPQSSVLFDTPIAILEGGEPEGNAFPWYILDIGNTYYTEQTLRKYSPSTGRVSTVVSTFGVGPSVSSSSVPMPGTMRGMAANADFTKIYILCVSSIREVDVATGTHQIVVGVANKVPNYATQAQTFERRQDGVGAAATFSDAASVTFDQTRNLLWITDFDMHAIRSVDLNAGANKYRVRTVAGRPFQSGFLDAIGLNAMMYGPTGCTMWSSRTALTVDVPRVNSVPLADLLFFCDSLNGAIRQLNVVTGAVETIILGDVDTFGFQRDSPETKTVYALASLILSPDGSSLYATSSIFTLATSDRLWKVDLITRQLTSIAPIRGSIQLVLAHGLFPSMVPAPGSGSGAVVQPQDTMIAVDRMAGLLVSLNLTTKVLTTLVGGGEDSTCVSAQHSGAVDGGPGIGSTSIPFATAADRDPTRSRVIFLDASSNVREFDFVTRQVTTLAPCVDSLTGVVLTLGLPAFLQQHPTLDHLFLFAIASRMLFVFDTTTNLVTSVAGGDAPGTIDGVGKAARFLSVTSGSFLDDHTLVVGDACRLRSIDLTDVWHPIVSTLAGQTDGTTNCAPPSGGVGDEIQYGTIASVAADPVDRLIYTVTVTPFCLLSRFNPATGVSTQLVGADASQGVLSGSGMCQSNVDGFSTADSQFFMPCSMMWAADQRVLYISTYAGPLRKFDPATGYLSTALGSSLLMQQHVPGSGAFGSIMLGLGGSTIANGLVLMPDAFAGAFTLIVTDGRPMISDFQPAYAGASTTSTVTLVGANFGSSAFDINWISCGQATGVSAPVASLTYGVSVISYVDVGRVVVQLPNNIPAGIDLRCAMSVRGVVGAVSLAAMRVIEPPVVQGVSPNLGLPMVASLVTLRVSFPSGTPRLGTKLSVTYGSNGLGSVCSGAVLTPAGVLCRLAADVAAGSAIKFRVALGAVSSASSATFLATMVAPTLTQFCPSTLPAGQPALLFLTCTSCASTADDVSALSVYFQNSVTGRVYATRRIGFKAPGVLAVNLPIGMPAGVPLAIRILYGSIDTAAFSTGALRLTLTDPSVLPPIVRVTPNTLSPAATSTLLSVELESTYVCSAYPLSAQASAIAFGVVSPTARVCTTGLTFAGTTVSCSVTAALLAESPTVGSTGISTVVQGRSLLVSVLQQGIPGLQAYQSAPTGGAALYVVGRVVCLLASSSGKLTGATEVKCRLPSPPLFGPVTLQVSSVATTPYVTSQVMTSKSVVFTTSDWSQWHYVRMEVPPDAGTMTIVYSVTVDGSHWLPPASATFPVDGAVAYQLAYGGFGQGDTCNAFWSSPPSSSAPPVGTPALLYTPTDAILSTDGLYLYLMDRNGSYVERYNLAQRTLQTVVGAPRVPNQFDTPPGDGLASAASLGGTPYQYSVFALRQSGQQMVLFTEADLFASYATSVAAMRVRGGDEVD